ncbi:repeat protein [Moumouvirus goulette]|uniref:Repeat protein n=1 Tax=Moumouvirus goulette TaxID=1247379 RepID=M1PFV7_9VIRU|nr:repeat protein [Moumouvirus goulette]AGF84878.1 repeat protein [Moumouvirus goulette]
MCDYDYINSKNNDGMTPLMLACEMSVNDSHVNLVSSLLDKYADPFLSNNNGETVLYLAQNGKNKKFALLLLFIKTFLQRR